jgi:dTDP-4-amino-4,6-dideoxygalactose transaminase
VKLRYLDGWNSARRVRAARYGELLSDAGLRLPEASPNAEHVYHLYVIRTQQREALQKHLAERGIGSAVHYPVPVHLQPAFVCFGGGTGSLPETEAAAGEILDLPMYPELRLRHVERVAAGSGRSPQRVSPSDCGQWSTRRAQTAPNSAQAERQGAFFGRSVPSRVHHLVSVD